MLVHFAYGCLLPTAHERLAPPELVGLAALVEVSEQPPPKRVVSLCQLERIRESWT